MKRACYLFLLVVLFGSCTAGTEDAAELSQQRVDSIVNSKTELLRTEMKRQNDSMINMMARKRADSILKGMKK